MIAPIAKGNAMEIDCKIDSWRTDLSSENSLGRKIRKVRPKSINGKPNLPLSNEGPMRWKLLPIDTIIKDIQINPSSPNMYCGQ